jgi:hypothetical protein
MEVVSSLADFGTSAVGAEPVYSAGTDLVGLWIGGPSAACDAAFALPTDEAATISFRTVPRDADADWRLVYLPILCCLFAAGCLALARIDGFLRWSQLAAVVCGVAWLLLLRPPIVGWIILAVVVGCRLHPSVRHVRERLLNVSPKLSGLRKT